MQNIAYHPCTINKSVKFGNRPSRNNKMTVEEGKNLQN